MTEAPGAAAPLPTPATTDDHALLRRARDGDDAAFRLLVERHHARVYALAARRLDDRDLAADVAQDVFLRLFRALPAFRFDAALATWLFRVTLNRCVDYERRRARERWPVPLAQAEQVAPAADPTEATDLAVDASHVAARVARLPAEFRDVLLLRYFGQQRYADIAATLDIPLGTVMSRIHRGLRQLALEFSHGSESP